MKINNITLFLIAFVNTCYGQFDDDTIRNCLFRKLEVTIWNSNPNEYLETNSILNINTYEFNSFDKITREKIGVGYSYLPSKSKISTYDYDSLGRKNIDSVVYLGLGSSPLEVSVYSYSDSINLVSIKKTFVNNQLIGRTFAKFDNKGYLIKEVYHDQDMDKPLYETCFEYYNNGKVKTKIHASSYNKNNLQIKESFFTYYDNGLTKSEIENDYDTIYYFYDEGQRLENICYADSLGKNCYTYQEAFGPDPLPYDSIYYDSEGIKFQLTEFKLSKNGKVSYKYLYVFDKRDNWIEKLHYRDNELVLFEERKIEYWE